ncbi:MAG: cytochrome oxidase [Deltaproteobacteria bacterium]|nr:cytochrome oxidase [Deltaproteobacteria bacterium]
MDVVILQAFVSLMIVVSMLLLFAYTLRKRTADHSDRLALLPLQDEPIGASIVIPTAVSTPTTEHTS